MLARTPSNKPPPVSEGIHPEIRKSALIIEDEKGVSLVLSTMLAALGFEVFTVGSAEEAHAFTSTLAADLVLLDLGLPGQSGEEWLREFRKTSVDTPVIAVSGVTDPLQKATVLRAGADDFVSKPFQIAEVEARISALLRRPRSLAERAMCNGLAYLNPRRCEIRVGEVRQALTMREFGLLWHLTLFEGRWVDAKTLCLAVFGETTEAHTESMRVHVSNLRHKLLHFSDVFAIEAERLVGYRIIRTSR